MNDFKTSLILLPLHSITDADVSKDRRSTDLFLKGLYLSNFENNDLKQATYRTSEWSRLPVKKRNSNHLPDTSNYNKLLVDYSKLATYDETKHYNDYNFNGVKIISRFSISSLNDTSIPIQTNAKPFQTTTATTKTITTTKPTSTKSRKPAVQFTKFDTIKFQQPENNTKSTTTTTTTGPFLIQVY